MRYARLIPLQERLQRLSHWFYCENDRPLIGFFYDSQYPLYRYRGAKNLPSDTLNPEDILVTDYLDDCDRLYEAYEKIGGDFIWSAAPFWGVPWIESSLGCQVIADFRTGSIHTNPPQNFFSNPFIPKFSENNPWVQKMLAFIPAMEDRSAGRYPVGMTLLRGISDILSALYGGERFVFEFYENPEKIRSVISDLTEYWIDFANCLLDHLPLFHGGTGAFFYHVWCPGKTLWFQEDAAALLSPALYEQFIYPFVCKITASFEHTVIHLHPSQFIPSEFLVKTKVNVIELHRDIGGPNVQELAEHHNRILSQKSLIVWGDMSIDEMKWLINHNNHKGLAIIVVVKEAEEAHHIWQEAMNSINAKDGNQQQ